MSTDVAAAAPVAPVPTVVKQTREHPPYSEMVQKAIAELKDRSGSSKVAILRYLTQNYQLGDNASKINTNIRLALKKGVERGELKQVTGTGANGSFKLGEKKGAAPKVKKPIVKKAKEVKPAAPRKERKAAGPKKSERTSKTPKKATSKTSKKAGSPAPKASKPRSAKPAAKKTTTTTAKSA